MPETPTTIEFGYIRMKIHENNSNLCPTDHVSWYKLALKLATRLHDEVHSYSDYCNFDFTEHSYKLHTFKIDRLKKSTIGYDREGNILWEVKWIGPTKSS